MKKTRHLIKIGDIVCSPADEYVLICGFRGRKVVFRAGKEKFTLDVESIGLGKLISTIFREEADVLYVDKEDNRGVRITNVGLWVLW